MFTLWPYMEWLLCMMVQDRCVIHVVNIIYVYNIPKKGLHVHLMALYGAVTMYDVYKTGV
jgi:hypothetical protein